VAFQSLPDKMGLEVKRWIEIELMRKCLAKAHWVLPRGHGNDNSRVLIAIAFYNTRVTRRQEESDE
jgi:hypothetical protein